MGIFIVQLPPIPSPIHHWQPEAKLLGLGALMAAFALLRQGYLLRSRGLWLWVST
ncbi:MAG: hypothetical protein HC796_11705 [Synechococcaceae cyanobacterium RL_1_2]|nr:hypothetical protein [Synechococcaceae cyanobacterium RL_1_2]